MVVTRAPDGFGGRGGENKHHLQSKGWPVYDARLWLVGGQIA